MENPASEQAKTSRFVVRDGKTFMVEDEAMEEFGDFTLKLLGELKHHPGEVNMEGYWVASCGVWVNDKIETRILVLSAGAFDSKARFLQELRKKYGGGTFNLGGGTTGSDLASYYSSLKEDTRRGPCRQFFKASHLGYQGVNYWLLAKDVHIENGKILSAEEYKFFTVDDAIHQYDTTINPELLRNQPGNLRYVCGRYLELANSFGVNASQFKLATAFVLLRNLRAMEPDADTWCESSIGILYSIFKNVGKSLTLNILGKGQGLPNRRHPLLCSGGDQTISGTSMKMLMQVLQSSTLTCMVDDPRMTDSLGEFLLQVQSGLSQGSIQSGIASPKGGVLLSTNSKENERLHGREIRLEYGRDPNFDVRHEEERLDELKALVEYNKGFLLAWIMCFKHVWTNGIVRGIPNLMRSVLANMVPDKQQRWYKGASYLMYTHVVFHVTSGVDPELPDITKALAECNLSAQDDEQPFLERLQEAIQSKLDDGQALRWITPLANVKCNGHFVPAIGLTCAALDSFSTVRKEELMRELDQLGCDMKKPQSMQFATAENVQLKDLTTRNRINTKPVKGIKIPKGAMDPKLMQQIEFACGSVVSDQQPERYTPTRTMPTNEINIAEEMERLHEVVWQIQDTADAGTDDPALDPPNDTHLQHEMSPSSRMTWTSLTPKRQRLYEQGIKAGLRLSAKRKDEAQFTDKRATEDPLNMSPSQSDEEENAVDKDAGLQREDPLNRSPSQSDEEENAVADNPECETPTTKAGEDGNAQTKRTLFEKSVPGTVGVLPRASTSTAHAAKAVKPKNKRKNKETREQGNKLTDCCITCGKVNPPIRKNSRHSRKVDWVQCDTCQNWFHNLCVGLSQPPTGRRWYCSECDTDY